jgi:hypothetical protein
MEAPIYQCLIPALAFFDVEKVVRLEGFEPSTTGFEVA